MFGVRGLSRNSVGLGIVLEEFKSHVKNITKGELVLITLVNCFKPRETVYGFCLSSSVLTLDRIVANNG